MGQPCYWCHGLHEPRKCTIAMNFEEACAFLGPIRCWPAKLEHQKRHKKWWLDGKVVGQAEVFRAAADAQAKGG